MNEIALYKDNVPKEWKEFLTTLSPEGKSSYEDFFYEKEMWNKIADEPTPLHLLKEREGGKKDGVPQILEYFPEEYTITELNRLFPGWWTENMKRSELEEIIKLENVIIEGYIMIPYPTPNGTKVRKLWAIAGSKIMFRQNTKIPVDLADNFKGARTEWIRIAGKWLGIGLDIYHQRITEQLRSMFEDICRALEILSEYNDEELGKVVPMLKKEATTIETGHGFRNFLKEQATPQQIERFYLAIKPLPPQKQVELWKHFLRFNNKSNQSTNQLNSWLDGLEAKMQKLQTKLKGD